MRGRKRSRTRNRHNTWKTLSFIFPCSFSIFFSSVKWEKKMNRKKNFVDLFHECVWIFVESIGSVHVCVCVWFIFNAATCKHTGFICLFRFFLSQLLFLPLCVVSPCHSCMFVVLWESLQKYTIMLCNKMVWNSRWHFFVCCCGCGCGWCVFCCYHHRRVSFFHIGWMSRSCYAYQRTMTAEMLNHSCVSEWVCERLKQFAQCDRAHKNRAHTNYINIIVYL